MTPGRENSRLNSTSGLAHNNLCSTKFCRMKKTYDSCVIRTHNEDRDPRSHLQFVIRHSTRVENTMLRYLQHSGLP